MKGKRSWGNIGEDYAVKLLLKNDYKILQRNFKSKIGEIDIVAKDKDILVFVEVKTRWNRKYGKPEEAVTAQKLHHIERTADYYLQTHPESPKKIRIDVVSIEVESNVVKSAKIIKVV